MCLAADIWWSSKALEEASKVTQTAFQQKPTGGEF